MVIIRDIGLKYQLQKYMFKIHKVAKFRVALTKSVRAPLLNDRSYINLGMETIDDKVFQLQTELLFSMGFFPLKRKKLLSKNKVTTLNYLIKSLHKITKVCLQS